MLNFKCGYLCAISITAAAMLVIFFLLQQSEPPKILLHTASLTQLLILDSSAFRSPLSRARKANQQLKELPEDTDYMYMIQDFEGVTDITLPFPLTTLPTKVVLQQKWVRDIQKMLSEISPESPPVHIIAGNYEYRAVLLNWLISAKVRVNPPLTNIIVVSIDSPLCQLLNKRNITCLFVHWKDYLVEELKWSFAAILVLRLTVIRLLNYWGYDAANIDTDALILRNPEYLYQELNDNDMLASRSRAPPELYNKWGVTMCGGAFMVRSTPNSEIYWRIVSRVNGRRLMFPARTRERFQFDDQLRLNYAFDAMDPVWKEKNSENELEKCSYATTVSGFTVTMFSEEMICRINCSEQLQSQYYVWHKPSNKNVQSKINISKQFKLWFLRRDWETLTSSATGEQWLKDIAII